MKNPYRTLKIKKKASDEEIKAAFKKLAKKHHPDVPGGNAEKFQAAKEAYDILIDEDARQRYDKFGVIKGSQEDFILGQALTTLGNLFLQLTAQLTDSDHIIKVDLVSTLNSNVRIRLKEIPVELDKLEKELTKCKGIAVHLKKRLKKNNKGKIPDVLTFAINDQIKMLYENINKKKAETKILEKILEIINDYEFDFEKEMSQFIQFSSSGTASTTTSW